MGIKDFFVSYFDNTNQIDSSYGTSSIIYILLIFAVLIALTVKKKNSQNNDYNPGEVFAYESTIMIRGLAIILLLIGHLSEKCIQGIGWFEDAGRWAVVIFLFLSGITISKTYGLDNLGKRFFVQRIRKLAFPFWLTLAFFILLDYFLLDKTYSIKRIIPAFLGITYPWPPNGPAWFITYISFLYVMYYFSSFLPVKSSWKSLVLAVLSYLGAIAIIYSQKLNNYFALWVIYTSVFPAAVVVGLNRKKIFKYLKVFYGYSRVVYVVILAGLFAFYYQGTNIDWLSQPDNIRKIFQTLQPLTLVCFLTMFTYLVDLLIFESKILLLLGEYSFEIYLLHFPFMEYYDFLLFRKPLFGTFFIYFAAIFLMSYLLRKISNIMNRRVLDF